jgi:hypothetical protein
MLRRLPSRFLRTIRDESEVLRTTRRSSNPDSPAPLSRGDRPLLPLVSLTRDGRDLDGRELAYPQPPPPLTNSASGGLISTTARKRMLCGGLGHCCFSLRTLWFTRLLSGIIKLVSVYHSNNFLPRDDLFIPDIVIVGTYDCCIDLIPSTY